MDEWGFAGIFGAFNLVAEFIRPQKCTLSVL